jgi:hypothetical protein
MHDNASEKWRVVLLSQVERQSGPRNTSQRQVKQCEESRSECRGEY